MVKISKIMEESTEPPKAEVCGKKIRLRGIRRTERHIRWNWQKSPDDENMARYHFIVVDDRDRKGTMQKLLEQLQQFGPLITIRSKSGKVEGSDYRYLFESYDCNVAPRELDLSRTGKPFVQDRDLWEREKGTLDDYVANFFGHIV